MTGQKEYVVILNELLTNLQEPKFIHYHKLKNCLLACLSDGQTLTILDLSHAYLQLELEKDSQGLVMINIHKGL